MLRLFIIEPLENFDDNVESDVDEMNIRPSRYAVKRNKYAADAPVRPRANLEWCA